MNGTKNLPLTGMGTKDAATEEVSLETLAEALAPRMAFMGLDVGEKTIGLAISDPELSIASPLETIRRRKFTPDAKSIAEIARVRDIGALVIGLPVNMDGTEGPRCQSVRQFAKNLAPITGLAYAFWDERLSTEAVTRTLIAADMSRKRRSEVVDKMAAAYILQGALDALSMKNKDKK